jgi:nucleotide-binding universal stress UspA family protein
VEEPPGQAGATSSKASILHPIDSSPASRAAFAHALALALVGRTRLDIVQVGSPSHSGWTRFPPVRGTLERWGLLERGSDRRAVYDELAVRIRKVRLEGHPVRTSLEYLQQSDPGLLVLGTPPRRGWQRWPPASLAEAVARRSSRRTLFVPDRGRLFVSPESGRLSLQRILIPVGRRPSPHEALLEATRLAEALGDPPVEIHLLHVGPGPFPACPRPEGPGWNWQVLRDEGPIDERIGGIAESIEADLIVMPTRARRRRLDRLRRSTSEEVVRRASCPVLVVPTPG